MRSGCRAGLFAILLASMLPALPVAAQDPSASETALARRLYREGLRHARGGRWEDARAAFQRSLDLAPRPATRLNLGTAQLETGLLVAAAESYRHYLAETSSERHKERARQLLQDLEPRIPTMLLTVDGLSDGDAVQLDGEQLSVVALGEPLPVDPGAHTVVVLRGAAELASEDITLEEGERRELSLRVPRPPPTPREVAERGGGTDGTSAATDVDDGGFVGSAGFWILAGAAAVALGVVVIVLAAGGETMGPHYEGNLGSVGVE